MKLERATRFQLVSLSVSDLVGRDYVAAVCRGRRAVAGRDQRTLLARLTRKVAFYPASFHRRMVALLPLVGKRIAPAFRSAAGAASDAFAAATNRVSAPLAGYGLYRVGEDGRLHLVTKSEHYHLSLGHAFPGYGLIEHARAAGIPNATHNNTRGHITRLLEEELVRAVNGIAPADHPALRRALASRRAGVVNRVLNLETGSLAVEAALKMLLSRFYRVQDGDLRPRDAAKTPVFLVIGDDDGGLTGNYHGTTVCAQMLRGMWPELRAVMERSGAFVVRAIVPNDRRGLERAFQQYGAGRYQIAGLLHELVLMNYGGKVLTPEFIRRAYALCRAHQAPTVCDEIQSCLWSPELFLFREYGLRPTCVVVGKGFPGGEYAASRLLFSADVDRLPQFGALVTNGQEELAALAYLITLRWAQANREVTRRIGVYYQERLRELADRHRSQVFVHGIGHMAALHFQELTAARVFAASLCRAGLDISVQSYKSSCPPAALTKLPLTAGYEVVDFIVQSCARALRDASF